MLASMAAVRAGDTLTSWPKPERSRSSSAATVQTVAQDAVDLEQEAGDRLDRAAVVGGLPPGHAERRPTAGRATPRPPCQGASAG